MPARERSSARQPVRRPVWSRDIRPLSDIAPGRGANRFAFTAMGRPAQCCILAAVKQRAGAPRRGVSSIRIAVGVAALFGALALVSATAALAQEQRSPQPVPPRPVQIPEPTPEDRAKAEAAPNAPTQPAAVTPPERS